MRKNSKIITIGLCPCWDVTCIGSGLGWGAHGVVDSVRSRPAGKAMNISRALAWMGQKSIAAGLWGRDDYEQMRKSLEPLRGMVTVKMTAAAGSTRQNINVVDTDRKKDMHLRSVSKLATKGTMATFRAELGAMVNRNSVTVFAGAMPGEFLAETAGIIKACHDRGGKVVVDTSGAGLKRLVNTGCVWLIKPNVEELRELVGGGVKDSEASLIKAGRKLLGKVDIVLISRGAKGAIVVTADSVWQGSCKQKGKVLSTVACGDFLLAGFLKGVKGGADTGYSLEMGLKAATARACGIAEVKSWVQVKREVRIVLSY